MLHGIEGYDTYKILSSSLLVLFDNLFSKPIDTFLYSVHLDIFIWRMLLQCLLLWVIRSVLDHRFHGFTVYRSQNVNIASCEDIYALVSISLPFFPFT